MKLIVSAAGFLTLLLLLLNNAADDVDACITPSSSPAISGSETTTTTIAPDKAVYLCRHLVGTAAFSYCGNTQGHCFSSTDTRLGGYVSFESCCQSNGLFYNTSSYNNINFCHVSPYYGCSLGDTTRVCVDFPVTCPTDAPSKMTQLTSYESCCLAINATQRTVSDGFNVCANQGFGTTYYPCKTDANSLDRSCYKLTRDCVGTATPTVAGSPYHTYADCCTAIGGTLAADGLSCNNNSIPYYVLCSRPDMSYCQTTPRQSLGETGCQGSDTGTTAYKSYSQCCDDNSFTKRAYFIAETGAGADIEFCHNSPYWMCSASGTHRVCLDLPALCPQSPQPTSQTGGPTYATFMACCNDMMNATSTALSRTAPAMNAYCSTTGNICSYSWSPKGTAMTICQDDITQCPGDGNRYNDFSTCCRANNFKAMDNTDVNLNSPNQTLAYCHNQPYFSCESLTNSIDKACYKLPKYCHTDRSVTLDQYTNFADCCTAIKSSAASAVFDSASQLLYCSSDTTVKYYYPCSRAASAPNEAIDYCANNTVSSATDACQATTLNNPTLIDPVKTTPAQLAYLSYSACCTDVNAIASGAFPTATGYSYCHTGNYFACGSTATSYDSICLDYPSSCPTGNVKKPASALGAALTGFTSFAQCCATIKSTTNASAVVSTSSPATCSTTGNICSYSWTPTGTAFKICLNAPTSCLATNLPSAEYIDFTTCCKAEGLPIMETSDTTLTDPPALRYCHNQTYMACKLNTNTYDQACYKEPLYCHTATRTATGVTYRSFADCCTAINASIGPVLDASSGKIWCNNDPQAKYWKCKRAATGPPAVAEMYYCPNKVAAVTTSYCQSGDTVQATAYSSYNSCCSANSFAVKGAFPGSLDTEFCTNINYYLCATAATAVYDRTCVALPGMCNAAGPAKRTAETITEFTSYLACCQSPTVLNSSSTAATATTPATCSTTGPICKYSYSDSFVTTPYQTCVNNPSVYPVNPSLSTQRCYSDYWTCCNVNSFIANDTTEAAATPVGTSVTYCHSSTYLACQRQVTSATDDNGLDVACYSHPSYCHATRPTAVSGKTYSTFLGCCNGIGATSGVIADAANSGLNFCNNDAQLKYYLCRRAASGTTVTQMDYCQNKPGSTCLTGTLVTTTSPVVAYANYSACCIANGFTLRNYYPGATPTEICHSSPFQACQTAAGPYDMTCYDSPGFCDSATKPNAISGKTSFTSYADCCADIKNTTVTTATSSLPASCATLGNICSYSFTDTGAGATDPVEFPICLNDIASCAEASKLNYYSSYTACCNANNFTNDAPLSTSVATSYCHNTPFYVCKVQADDISLQCYQRPYYCDSVFTDRVPSVTYKTFADCCTAINATSGIISDGANSGLYMCNNLKAAKYQRCTRPADGTISDAFVYCHDQSSDPATGDLICHGSDTADTTAYYSSYAECCSQNAFTRKNYWPAVVNPIEYCHSSDFFSCATDVASSTATDRVCFDMPSSCSSLLPGADAADTQITTTFATFDECCSSIKSSSLIAADNLYVQYCATDGQICSFDDDWTADGDPISAEPYRMCLNTYASCQTPYSPVGYYRDFAECCNANELNQYAYRKSTTTDTDLYCHSSVYYSCQLKYNQVDLACYDQPLFCYEAGDDSDIDEGSTRYPLDVSYKSFNDCCNAIRATAAAAMNTESGVFRCDNNLQQKYYKFVVPTFTDADSVAYPELTYCKDETGVEATAIAALPEDRFDSQDADPNTKAYLSWQECCADNGLSKISTSPDAGVRYCHSGDFWPCRYYEGAGASPDSEYQCLDMPSQCYPGTETITTLSYASYNACCDAIGYLVAATKADNFNYCYRSMHNSLPAPSIDSTCGHSAYYYNTDSAGAGIVGGHLAAPGEFPWLVRLKSDANSRYGHGVLVATDQILTTADLIQSYDTTGTWKIILGEWLMNASLPEISNTGPVIKDAASGLALVPITAQDFTTSWDVQRICLPATCTDACEPGKMAYATGWGAANPTTDVFQQVAMMPISDADTCDAEWSTVSLTSRLCTSREFGTDISGEMGAPLMVVQANATFTLCGLSYPRTSSTKTTTLYAPVCSSAAISFLTTNGITFF